MKSLVMGMVLVSTSGILSGCASTASAPAVSGDSRPEVEARIVLDYVKTTKHMPDGSYRISSYGPDKDGNTNYAVYCKSSHEPPPEVLGGDGCSIILVVDFKGRRVEKEYPVE